MKVGDVLRFKITGINAIILKDGEDGQVLVRTQECGTNGVLCMVTMYVQPFELEEVKESIQREFDEMIYKNKLTEDYVKASAKIEEPLSPMGVVQ